MVMLRMCHSLDSLRFVCTFIHLTLNFNSAQEETADVVRRRLRHLGEGQQEGEAAAAAEQDDHAVGDAGAETDCPTVKCFFGGRSSENEVLQVRVCKNINAMPNWKDNPCIFRRICCW